MTEAAGRVAEGTGQRIVFHDVVVGKGFIFVCFHKLRTVQIYAYVH
jgi:hypothetical protein